MPFAIHRHAGLFLGALLLCGCTPKLDPAEVKQMLLEQPRGVIGGVDFGDSWDRIKADHDKRYTVRDDNTKDGTFRQLRHDLNSPGENGFFITFDVDAQGKVASYNVSIYGRKGNMLVVRGLVDDLIAYFDKKIGGGHCGASPGSKGNSTDCDWTSKPGAPQVGVDYLDMSDIQTGSIEISVKPPAKK
jgi:hypothetical protein